MRQGFRKFISRRDVTISPDKTYVLTVLCPNFSFSPSLFLFPSLFFSSCSSLFASGKPAKSPLGLPIVGKGGMTGFIVHTALRSSRKSYTTWIISVARVSTYVHEVGAYFSVGYTRFLSRSTRTAWISYAKSYRMHKNATRRSFIRPLPDPRVERTFHNGILEYFWMFSATAVNIEIYYLPFFSRVYLHRKTRFAGEAKERHPSSDYKVTRYEIQKMSEIRDFP